MRRNLLFMLALGAWVGAAAAPLTPQEALARLGGETRAVNRNSLQLAFTSRQTAGEAAVYVFNNSVDGGYLLLSADDCAAPLLGYSEVGKFEEREMSAELRWWIGEYGRQIEYAKSHGAGEYVSQTTRADRKGIAPLVKTKWNQSSPYNGMTPTVDGKHCVTGCVATSMAQVMKYWNYPEIGKGSGECTVVDNSGSDTTDKMSFSEQKFDWSNMLDIYAGTSTQAQKDAVAYLMKACGYAVKMTYTSNESGAASLYVAQALMDNFSYNKNLQYCSRDYYTPTEWEDMVYGELEAGRPIVYGGQSTIGGHSFICDGYSSDGYYHFNWGWGGMSDGYFLLNALDPGSLGIGANGGGYNFFQDIVRGIQPQTGPDWGHDLLIDGLMTGSIKGQTLTMAIPSLYNSSGKDLEFALGAKITNEAGSYDKVVPINGWENAKLQLGYLYNNLELPVNLSASMPDGTYKVTLCLKTTGTDTWRPVLAKTLEYNYLTVVKSGNRFTVHQNKSQNVKVTDGGAAGQLVYGQASKLTITVNNPTDRDVTKSFYPVLCEGITPVLAAEGVTLNIAAGATITKEFECLFEPYDGGSAPSVTSSYNLKYYDPNDADSYGDPSKLWIYPGFSKVVTMEIGEKPELVGESFTMPGIEKETSQGLTTYKVTDLSKVPFSCTISNKGGYFNNPISFYVMVHSGAYLQAIDQYSIGTMEIAKDGKATAEAELDLSSIGDGEFYAFLRGNDDYIRNSSEEELFVYFVVDTTGVGEIVVSDPLVVSYSQSTGIATITGESAVNSIEVYSLDGKRCHVATEAAGSEAKADMSSLPSGVYVLKVVAADGASRTLKLRK